jgi:hypothetical protein
MNTILLNIILAINVNWSSITDPFNRLFFGGNYTTFDGTTIPVNGIFGDPTLAAIFIFFILFLLTLMAGLGMLVGSVVIIPSLFAIFQYIPDLKIIVAIICGLTFGLALHKLVRR